MWHYIRVIYIKFSWPLNRVCSPRAGLIHYQQNMDCLQTAQYLITYNSEHPGLQNTFTALFELVRL